MTRITAEHLTVNLRGRTALQDVSFDMSEPGLIALVGPNGAGKSTLLRALAGLIPLTGGTVRIAGQDLARMESRERARAIGYLPQDRTVHWPLPARDVVALGRLPHQRPGAHESGADRLAITQALAAMDAEALAARPVLELSGGERARILIARVLAQQPAVMLADEPTAGLDPEHQWALFERLEAAATSGMRILVALHDLSLASRFARTVLLLADGRLVAMCPPAEALTAERLTAVFGISSTTVEHAGHRFIVPVGRTSRL